MISVSRTKLIAEARSWTNTRFHHLGRVKGAGCDCAGLVVCVYRTFGVTIPDEKRYAKRPDPELLMGRFEQVADQIALIDTLPGDIVLFHNGIDPQHMAIVSGVDARTNQLSMIHAFAGARKVVEHRLDAYWMGQFMSAWTVKGVRWLP